MMFSTLTLILALSCLGNSATVHHLYKRVNYVSVELYSSTNASMSDHP